MILFVPSVILFVPIRTTNPLNGAQRRRWQAVAAARRKQREAVVVAWLSALDHEQRSACRTKGLRWRIKITRASAGQLDGDGLQAALKTVRDQIADCLGFRDDSDPRLDWRYAQRKCERGLFGVEVEIAEAV